MCIRSWNSQVEIIYLFFLKVAHLAWEMGACNLLQVVVFIRWSFFIVSVVLYVFAVFESWHSINSLGKRVNCLTGKAHYLSHNSLGKRVNVLTGKAHYLSHYLRLLIRVTFGCGASSTEKRLSPRKVNIKKGHANERATLGMINEPAHCDCTVSGGYKE